MADTPGRLTPELAVLVHHIELNRSGWRDRFEEQQVIAVIHSTPSPIDIAGIQAVLNGTYGTTLNIAQLERIIAVLESKSVLVRPTASHIKLSETAGAQLSAQLRDSEKAEFSLKQRFLYCLAQVGVGANTTDHWRDFKERCLLPLVQQLGAQTYEVLTGEGGNLAASQAFSTYTGEFPVDIRHAVREAIRAFLDPADLAVRAFVLQHLHAYFLLRAGGLPMTTIEALSDKGGKGHRIALFLDTNFLFSILELHDNPSNEAAADLARLIPDVRKRLKLKLYVLPITVDETRRTLSMHEERLARLQLTARLSRAATVIEDDLSGITKRYVQAARNTGTRLSARDYFGPFINDLITILRSRGVELYNENLDSWGMRQDIIDDIVDQQRFEARARGDRAKSYEAIRHDVIFWHFIKSKRPAAIDSPLDAGYWAATIDFRLIAFDAFKQRLTPSHTPVCVHPSSLIQMLQFWVPRSEQFDLALFNSIRSMLPKDFDIEAERAAVGILSALSRFQNIDDLPEDSLANILVNDALRQRIRQERSHEAQVQLIKDEIIEEVERAKQLLETERNQRAALEDSLKTMSQTHGELHGSYQVLQAKLKEKENLVLQQSKEVEESKQLQEERIRRLESVLQEKEDLEARSRNSKQQTAARFRFLAKATLWMVVLVLASSIGAYFGLRHRQALLWLSMTGATAVALLIWLQGVDMAGRRDPRIREWPPFVALHEGKKWFFAFFGTIITGAIANILSELASKSSP